MYMYVHIKQVVKNMQYSYIIIIALSPVHSLYGGIYRPVDVNSEWQSGKLNFKAEVLTVQ